MLDLWTPEEQNSPRKLSAEILKGGVGGKCISYNDLFCGDIWSKVFHLNSCVTCVMFCSALKYIRTDFYAALLFMSMEEFKNKF